MEIVNGDEGFFCFINSDILLKGAYRAMRVLCDKRRIVFICMPGFINKMTLLCDEHSFTINTKRYTISAIKDE